MDKETAISKIYQILEISNISIYELIEVLEAQSADRLVLAPPEKKSKKK